jgi:hypothetical protein
MVIARETRGRGARILLRSRFHFLGGQFVTHVATLPGNP